MVVGSMGDSISEGTVVEWRKAVGDSVEEDEIIAVVETDKVSVDIRSTHVGVVVKLFAAVDDVVSRASRVPSSFGAVLAAMPDERSGRCGRRTRGEKGADQELSQTSPPMGGRP